MTKTPSSPWTPQETILGGQAMCNAAIPFSDLLEPRLGKGFIGDLQLDLRRLVELNSGRAGSVEKLKGKTRALEIILAEATRFSIAVRDAITTRFPIRHPMRSEFGVSIKTNAKSMKATIAVLQMLIHGMEQYPTEAAMAGLSAGDLTRLKGFLSEIMETDEAQEQRKYQRKANTALVDAVNYSVYKKLNQLKVAAGLDLVDNPKAYNQIVAPLPGGTRTAKKARSKTE